ncbi:MAG: Peptidoglycan O-acetyltransferase [bacterium]|nr:Peptidoglycan O-acetyltransferase [bacterium]
MLFNSWQFLIFFPLVVAAYFLLPHRLRWMLLLGASYYFYMCWKPEYALLLMFSTVIDYYTGLQMGKATSARKRKFYLGVSLSSNLGILFLFKYFNFLNASARAVFDQFNLFYNVPMFELLLPVGISFYTFQTLSYSIDVYRGRLAPEKHLGMFALYVTFFPQLVAGPIERSTNLLPQFYRVHGIDRQRILDGLKLMLWGFFKKIVIADRLAVYVNQAYNNPAGASGADLLVATYFFAFQIYCDFSGYSDIAIGAARVMGFELMENFRRPYLSQSIAEFWQRWHISLSTWFKDYLYIPLGGNRVAKWRWLCNLFIVFLVSGLWHGANWTFVVWGALHGFYLVFSIWTDNARRWLWQAVRLDRLAGVVRVTRMLLTFHLVLFAWIFFRANHLADAYLIITKIAPAVASVFRFELVPAVSLIETRALLLMLVLITGMSLYERFQSAVGARLGNRYARVAFASVLFWVILVWGAFNNQQFIYFQF